MTNDAIRAPRVLVIDETGTSLGEMSRTEALDAARAAELDLVEVAPGANPPVCKLADAGKLRYEASQKAKLARSKGPQTKEVKFKPAIGEHDYRTKVKHAREFLANGHRVKVTVTLHGRLINRPQAADEILARLVDDLGDCARVEGQSRSGRLVTAMFVPTL